MTPIEQERAHHYDPNYYKFQEEYLILRGHAVIIHYDVCADELMLGFIQRCS